MENKKKIVVVGTGIIGIEHIKAIEASEHFSLCALCDGEQSLTPAQFDTVMSRLKKYAAVENKTL